MTSKIFLTPLFCVALAACDVPSTVSSDAEKPDIIETTARTQYPSVEAYGLTDTYSALKAKAEATDHNNEPKLFLEHWTAVKELAATKLPDNHPEIAQVNASLALAKFMSGDLVESEAMLRQSITDLDGVGGEYEQSYIQAMNDLSISLNQQGRSQEAKDILIKVVSEWDKSTLPEAPREAVIARNNLSFAESGNGDHDRALEIAYEALEMARDVDEGELREAYLLTNIPLFHYRAGRLDRALLEARLGLARMSEIVDDRHVVRSALLASSAKFLLLRGRYPEAEKAIRQSIDIRTENYGPRSGSVLQVQRILLELLEVRGDYDAAIHLATDMVENAKVEFGPEAVGTLNMKIRRDIALMKSNPNAENLSQLKSTVDEISRLTDAKTDTAIKAKLHLAHFQFEYGDAKDALITINSSLDGQATDPEYTNVLRRSSDALKGLIETKLGLTEPETGFERAYNAFLAEKRIQERALNQQGRHASVDTYARNVMDYALQSALLSENHAQVFEIAQLISTGSAQKAAAKRDTDVSSLSFKSRNLYKKRQSFIEDREVLFQRLDDISENSDVTTAISLSRQINDLSERIDQITFPNDHLTGATLATVTLNDLQSKIPPDTVYFMPVMTETGIVRLTITPDNYVVSYDKIDPVILRRSVTQILENLQLGQNLSDENLTALSDHIMSADVMGLLRDKSQVFVTTNNAFSQIPFSILRPTAFSKINKSGYFIDNYALSIFPTPAYLSQNTSPQTLKPKTFVGLAASNDTSSPQTPNTSSPTLRSGTDIKTINQLPPLPGAKAEVTAVSELGLGRTSIVLTGDDATETAVKTMRFESGDILMIAAHGLLGGELDGIREPTLVLAESQTDDGLWTASEIADTPLPLALVILSACNSAGIAPGQNDALSGLASSFMLAGTQSLLVSHWPVRDDAAAFLTVETLKHTQAGYSKSRALQKAILDLRKQSSIAGANSPAVWAPFSFVGQ